MTPLRRRAARVFREEGPVSLVRQSAAYLSHQTGKRIREAAWRLRGEYTVSVGDVDTTFHVGNLTEARGLRYLVEQERVVLADVLSALREDDVFFDVGANVGLYTCFAGARLAGDDIVAFEPYPPNAERIRENLHRNGREATVKRLALSDEPGSAEFDRGSMRPGWPFASLRDDGDDTIQVSVETGDRLVERGDVPHPTVVKIDVEGAEELVLEGLAETLRDDRCRLVYCEVHRPTDHRQSIADFGGSEAEVRDRLAEWGFEVTNLLDREDEVFLRATR